MTDISPPAVLPVSLLLSGRRCLVVGGGPVGTDKVRALLAARAVVHVVSPEVTDDLATLIAERTDVTWRQGTFVESDLADVRLVVTATGVREVDDEIFARADERGLWVNSADDPERCSFYLMATVRRDPVVVAITTAGASPAMASYLRRRLDGALEPELGDVALLLRRVRRDLQAAGVPTEGLPWSRAITPALFDQVRHGDLEAARTQLHEALRPS